MKIILNIIKIGLSIGLVYNTIKGNTQNAIFFGICILLMNQQNKI